MTNNPTIAELQEENAILREKNIVMENIANRLTDELHEVEIKYNKYQQSIIAHYGSINNLLRTELELSNQKINRLQKEIIKNCVVAPSNKMTDVNGDPALVQNIEENVKI